MTRYAVALVALVTLSTGCAIMKTDRGGGPQIQRTAQPEETTDTGAIEGRPELGQR